MKNYQMILPLLTPNIIGWYSKDWNVPIKKARQDYFNSSLYQSIQNTDTGLWHYSTRLLAELLHDEKVKGYYDVPEVAA